MDINNAENQLLEIMETVEAANGDCHACPFWCIIRGTDRPFTHCPDEWEFKV